MDSCPVIELSDDDDEVLLQPKATHANKRGCRAKKVTLRNTAAPQQPSGRRKHPVTVSSSSRSANRPEVVVLDSPEPSAPDSRANQIPVSEGDSPDAAEGGQKKTRAKRTAGLGRGCLKKSKKANCSLLTKGDRSCNENDLTSIQQGDVLLNMNGGHSENTTEKQCPQPLQAQASCELGRQHHSGADTATGSTECHEESSEFPGKGVKIGPTETLLGVAGGSRLIGSSKLPVSAAGLSKASEHGGVKQQAPQNTAIQEDEVDDDEDDDDDDELFSYGSSKAPPPRWDEIKVPSHRDREGERRKLLDKVDKLEETSSSESEDMKMADANSSLAQEVFGRRFPWPTSPSSKKSSALSRTAKSGSSSHVNAASLAGSGDFISSWRAQMEANDAETLLKLAQINQHNDDSNLVKAVLNTDPCKLLGEANLTPPEKHTALASPSPGRTTGEPWHATEGGSSHEDLAPSEKCNQESNLEDQVEQKIRLKVATANGEYAWKISKKDALAKLFEALAKKIDEPLAKLTFSFDGETLRPSDTPESKDLEDEDKIDVTILD